MVLQGWTADLRGSSDGVARDERLRQRVEGQLEEASLGAGVSLKHQTLKKGK